MSIIEAKCPNCGAPLKLDTEKDASYCEFCKTPFVTEKAIKVSGDYVKGDKIVNNISNSDHDEWSYKVAEQQVSAMKWALGFIAVITVLGLLFCFLSF